MAEDKKKSNFEDSLIEIKRKSEFTLILIKNKKKVSKALVDFLIGVKNEAYDTKETSRIIVKYLYQQKITKDEEKHLKVQVYDVFKILGVGVPFMLIPGASIIIPFILKVAEKKGIDLYPSNFKSKDKPDATTLE
ncbi:LETM1-like protein [Lutibacter agarilyticus]|uniref:LETM1-like protein n=1 Tax=Lutibacter agarilyticus TaxID=1109740 RepID=A0A238XQA3_9FLAO|nr:LETM1 domain-containing protein [Lutibacter agarilyticus]SNR61206.1 LETM1-like protein [Lutibacter agarilyticus]